MIGLTDFITQARWSDIFLVWLVEVDDAYEALRKRYGEWRRRGPAPVFWDSEVITVALIIDTFFHGHEAMGLTFLRQYHSDLFPHLPSEGHFNERRGALAAIIEQVRQQLVAHHCLIGEGDTIRIVDSAPIPVCTYTRAKQNQTLCGQEYFGVMPSRKAKLFGLRLHMSSTSEGVVDRWLLAPASIKDGKVTAALFDDAHATDLSLLADGAYHNPMEENVLRCTRNITLWAVPRKDARKSSNWHWPASFRRCVAKLRRRIETAFSVLVQVFNIERPGSRSLRGLVGRVATRILAYTLCFVSANSITSLAPSITQN